MGSTGQRSLVLLVVWSFLVPISVGSVAAGVALPTLSAVPLSDCYRPDNGDPAPTSFSASVASVDVRSSPQEVNFAATFEDTGGPGAPTGVAEAYVVIGDAGIDDPSRAASGSMRRGIDGVWRATLTVPRWAAPRRWPLTLFVRDQAGTTTAGSTGGNVRNSNYQFLGGEQLVELGFPGYLTVRSTKDIASPRLRSLSLSRLVVDARKTHPNVRVTGRLTDDVGVDRAAVTLGGTHGTDLRLVRGTVRDGTWSGLISLAHPRRLGALELLVSFSDHAYNDWELDAKELAARRLPWQVLVTGEADTRPPVVSDIRVSARSVDARFSDPRVTIRARVQDVDSGVSSVDENRWWFEPLRLVRGTRKDGVWRGVVTFDHCVATTGDYTFAVKATDRALRSTSTPVPNQAVAVSTLDNEQDWARRHYRIAPTDPVRIWFPDDMTGLDATTGTVHAIFPDGSYQLVSGVWSCTRFDGVTADCGSERWRVAQFTADVPRTDLLRYVVELNPEHTLGLVDMAGNPSIPRAVYRIEVSQP